MRDQIAKWLNPEPGNQLPNPNIAEGDYRLNPSADRHQAYTAAAVLVPLVAHESGMTVLLTLRTDHLHDHAGQVSFPGGRMEPADSSSTATALREAEEEIGLVQERVEVVGFLDRYRTMTGFDIEPVVGIVEPGFSLSLDAFEVAEAFEVPLDRILRRQSFRRQSRVYQGRRRYFYEISYDQFHIWGATAGILHNLYLRASRPVAIS